MQCRSRMYSLIFWCTACPVYFEHDPVCPVGPCSKMALRKGAKGRGDSPIFLPYFSSCHNLHWPHEPVKNSLFEGKSYSLSSAALPWSGRKSCSVTTVSAESCSQPVSVWLLSPALVFTLIPVTLLALHWFDFKILSWIWIPCAHGLGRICLFVCVLMVCLSWRLL